MNKKITIIGMSITVVALIISALLIESNFNKLDKNETGKSMETLEPPEIDLKNLDEHEGFSVLYTPSKVSGLNRDSEKYAVLVDESILFDVPKIKHTLDLALEYTEPVAAGISLTTHMFERDSSIYRVIKGGVFSITFQNFISQEENEFYKNWAYDNLEPTEIHKKPDVFYIEYKDEIFNIVFEKLNSDIYD